MARVAVLTIPLMLVLPFVMVWRSFASNLSLLGYALIASAVLQTAFAVLKSTIPALPAGSGRNAFRDAVLSLRRGDGSANDLARRKRCGIRAGEERA